MCFKCDKKGHIAKDCRGKQIMKKRKMKTTRKKSRVLTKILSRHGTRDLLCKIPE